MLQRRETVLVTTAEPHRPKEEPATTMDVVIMAHQGWNTHKQPQCDITVMIITIT